MTKIRISPAIANEFCGRGVFEQFQVAGYYHPSIEEIRALRADAERKAETKSGPGFRQLSAGARLAYRGLAQQLRWIRGS